MMRRQRYGKIINIASGTVFKGTPMMLHYVASKGAIVAMTRALARELGEDGICCNALAPGLTLSNTVKGRNDYSEVRRLNVESRALKREETPDDLVGALLFLARATSSGTRHSLNWMPPHPQHQRARGASGTLFDLPRSGDRTAPIARMAGFLALGSPPRSDGERVPSCARDPRGRGSRLLRAEELMHHEDNHRL